jgi:hypothetical protein
MAKQSVREGGTDSGQTLQQKEPPRCEAFGLPVESAEDLMLGPACLIGQDLQNSQGMLRVGRMEHREPPHRGQRDKRPFERVGCTAGIDSGVGPSIRRSDR